MRILHPTTRQLPELCGLRLCSPWPGRLDVATLSATAETLKFSLLTALRSRLMEVEGTKMKVLQLESLIESKKTLDRPRDRQAVVQLEAIQKLRED